MYIHLVNNEESKNFIEKLKELDKFLEVLEYSTFTTIDSNLLTGYLSVKYGRVLRVYPRNEPEKILELDISNIDTVFSI